MSETSHSMKIKQCLESDFNVFSEVEGTHIIEREPVHIHIQRDRMLASSTRFSSRDLKKLTALVKENEELLMEAWNEYFSS